MAGKRHDDTDRLLATAVEHHRAGRLTAAEAAYRRVLARTPNHADALHLLGVAVHQLDRAAEAVELIGRALTLRPDLAQAHFNLGGALESAGRPQEAEAAYARALALDPGYAKARASLEALRARRSADARLGEAIALHRAGDLDAADAAYRQVLALEPANADALHLLGVVAHQSGRDAQAIEWIGRALDLDPDFAQAHNNLGLILQALGRLEAAEAHGRRAVALNPAYAEAYTNLGNTLRERDRLDEAEALHRKALELRPDYGEAYTNLGAVFELRGAYGDAVACHRRALDLRPGLADAHNNLGTALLALGRRDEALASFERTIDIKPDFGLAHWNRGLLRLERGEPAEGWAEYEWRHRTRQLQPGRTFAVPAWQGEDLTGKRILVWREQGVGDELMFAGLYAELIARAGRVTIECDPRLVPLFARSFPQATVRAETPDGARPANPVPEVDRHVAAGSLPRRLRPDLTHFPPHRGYLVPDPERVAAWRERLDALGPGLKVGLCWRSQALSANRTGSYTGLDAWEPILRLPGVRFVNLQYDRCEDEILRIEHRFGVGIARWPDLDLKNDFDGVAALMAGLDLVITGPTSVGELAAALGVPVWRLAFLGDWSMLGTGCRPWFPSMRLFYAHSQGSLIEVLEAIGRKLRGLMAEATDTPPSETVPAKTTDWEDRLARAVEHHRAGRIAEAEPLYRSVLDDAPDQPAALHLLGLIAHQTGRHGEAVETIGRALAVAPDYAAAHTNRGNALQALGRLEEAEASHRRALALDPDFAEAHANLGSVLQKRSRPAEAEAAFRAALARQPDLPAAWAGLGGALRQMGRYDAAVPCFHHALGLAPDDAESWSGLGLALQAKGEPEAAAAFEHALTLDPSLASARLNRGLLRLEAGDLGRGWDDYAARFAATGRDPGRRFAVPEWRGEPLDGRRLMVWREQGVGDELMFASCYPDLPAGSLVECDRRLVSLFARSFPHLGVRAEAPDTDDRPTDFDAHAPAGALPRLLRPDPAAFPTRPHLVADPERVAAWRADLGDGVKVGIGWRSRLVTGGRAGAYTDLLRWAPILSVPGVTFANLQYDRCDDEIEAACRRFGIRIRHRPDLDLMNDLEAAAALTSCLDLVITAATSVGEMAAGLGVPTWRFAGAGDWTVLGTTVRPWFPSQRLFPARSGETLDGVLARIGAELRARVRS